MSLIGGLAHPGTRLRVVLVLDNLTPSDERTMSSFRLIIRSLTYHWRLNLTVALGVAVATAVLVGALMVRDSMRASLRGLVVEQLGRIDPVVVADHFFRAALADEIAATDRFAEDFTAAKPAIVIEAAVEHQATSGTGGLHRAGRVTVLGTGPWFWEWGRGVKPASLPGSGQVVLNEPLAETLAAGVGDDVIVRLARPGSIPADSPLGKKTDNLRSRRLKVVAIVPARGLGRFGLRFSQQLPRNAYLATETLQSILAQPGKVNAVLIAAKSATVAAPPVGVRMPHNIWMVVVLPAPSGPTRPKISPGCTSRLRSCTASMGGLPLVV